MKYQNLKFLSKANIKGNKNSGAIVILTCLLVIAITIISCFSIVTVTNYIFSHKSYQDMLYIIDWNLFLTYLGISLATAIIVPLLCQIISLKILINVQPREAMSAN